MRSHRLLSPFYFIEMRAQRQPPVNVVLEGSWLLLGALWIQGGKRRSTLSRQNRRLSTATNWLGVGPVDGMVRAARYPSRTGVPGGGPRCDGKSLGCWPVRGPAGPGRRGHLLFFDIEQPTRDLRIDFDSNGCDIASVSTRDLIPSVRPTRIELPPTSLPPGIVRVDLDGWIFPRSGVAFAWTLNSEQWQRKITQPGLLHRRIRAARRSEAHVFWVPHRGLADGSRERAGHSARMETPSTSTIPSCAIDV